MKTPKDRAIVFKAFFLALDRHGNQVDKQGKPYIGHLLRVAARVADDPLALAAALLHDAMEDAHVRPVEMQSAGLPQEVIDAVCALTKDRSLTYMENIERAASHPLAWRVKIADLQDNLDPTRRIPGPNGESMRERYRKALTFLEEKGEQWRDKTDLSPTRSEARRP